MIFDEYFKTNACKLYTMPMSCANVLGSGLVCVCPIGRLTGVLETTTEDARPV